MEKSLPIGRRGVRPAPVSKEIMPVYIFKYLSPWKRR